MPITFARKPGESFFEVHYTGTITDEELLSTWTTYLGSSDWIQGLDEFADLSRADAAGVTTDGLRALADLMNNTYRKNGITSIKVGVFAPHPLPFGLARMYEVFAHDSPENVKVFDDEEQAKKWLRGDLKAKRAKS